jgi:hypothetical protein
MKFSSFLHHLGFAASISSPWSIALGQEVNHYRNDENTIFSGKNKGNGSNLRNHYSVQSLRGGEVLFEQSRNEFDSQVSNLETWILADKDQEEKPCAWGDYALGETLDFESPNNYAFPSFDANYWVTKITIEDLASSTIKLTGKPPTARYYSFQTYTADDQYSSVVGAIADVNITLAADGSFTILINNGHDDTGDAQGVNSLRGLPNGANEGTIVLMYRTYLPVPLTSPAGGVNLPLISFRRGLDGGELVDLEYCNEAEPIIEIKEPIEYETIVQRSKLPARSVEYFRTTGRFTPFPNEDIAYLATVSLVFPVKGYAVVVRGMAPTFDNGGDEENPQVRYWSMCQLALPSTKTISCLKDEDAILDSQGRYVIVVAPERPSGIGFDFLSFGPGPIGVLALRNMLPSPKFYNMSVQNVNSEDDDSEIRRKLGIFYPETVYCPIATIEDEGVHECF